MLTKYCVRFPVDNEVLNSDEASIIYKERLLSKLIENKNSSLEGIQLHGYFYISNKEDKVSAIEANLYKVLLSHIEKE